MIIDEISKICQQLWSVCDINLQMYNSYVFAVDFSAKIPQEYPNIIEKKYHVGFSPKRVVFRLTLCFRCEGFCSISFSLVCVDNII